LKGNGCGVIVVLSRHLSGRTSENVDKSQTGWQLLRQSFEPITSRIRVLIVTAKPFLDEAYEGNREE
jgi:hypothetical protein